MPLFRVLAVLGLCGLPFLAAASEDQLLAQIRVGLASHGIEANLEALTRDQRATLYLELSSSEEVPGGDIRTRNALLFILSQNPETEPVRK